MAKLKATPKNFAEACSVLNGKYSVRLGNNTYLRCTGPDPVHDYIAVTFHATDIIKFWADGQVTLHTGGYKTVTTKERINQFTRCIPGQVGARVYQKNRQWYVTMVASDGAHWDVIFEEGMNVSEVTQ